MADHMHLQQIIVHSWRFELVCVRVHVSSRALQSLCSLVCMLAHCQGTWPVEADLLCGIRTKARKAEKTGAHNGRKTNTWKYL